MKKITTLLLLALATTNTLFSAGALTQASQAVGDTTYTLSWRSTEAFPKGELNTEKKTITVPTFVESKDRSKKWSLLTITYADDTQQNNTVKIAQLLADNIDKIASSSHLGLMSREGAKYYFRADDLRNVNTADMNEHNSDSDIFYQVLFGNEQPTVKVTKKETVEQSTQSETRTITIRRAPKRRPSIHRTNSKPLSDVPLSKRIAAAKEKAASKKKRTSGHPSLSPKEVAVARVITKKETVAPKAAAAKEATAVEEVAKPVDRIVENLQYSLNLKSPCRIEQYLTQHSNYEISVEIVTTNSKVESHLEQALSFQYTNISEYTGKSDETKKALAEQIVAWIEESLKEPRNARLIGKEVTEEGQPKKYTPKPFWLGVYGKTKFLEIKDISELQNPLYRNYLKKLIIDKIWW